MRNVILDTNVYVALAKGDPEIIKFVRSADVVHFSIFVYTELIFGFRNGSKELRSRNILHNFLSTNNIRIIHTTKETSEIFSEIKLSLKKHLY